MTVGHSIEGNAMSDQMPAPGWYPAPHANNEQRYWDGAQWVDPRPTHSTLVRDETVVSVSGSANGGYAPAKKPAGLAIAALVVGIVAFLTGIVPVVGAIIGLAAITLGIFALAKRQSKGFGITGIALGAVALISSVAVTAGISANLPLSKPASVDLSQVEEARSDESAAPESTPEPVTMVTVPDVAGMTVTDALAALTAAGLKPPALATFEDPQAAVVSASRAPGSEAPEGADITLTVQEKPKLTLAQQNAIESAQSYLEYSGFSRVGLIDQLEYEGFTVEEATFGADNAGADWGAECAETAKSYLEYSAFSRQGLYDQLAYEGFLAPEIEHGLAAVGY